VLGTEFTRTLRAAQAGDAQAFTRLWRDANPVIVRYLRVVGHDDPYDGACEGWVTVLRGLLSFRGDEAAWWVWLLQCARMRAQDGTLRRAWGSSAPALTRPRCSTTDAADGEVDPLDVDDLDAPGGGGGAHRGLSDTLSALRGLPLGQGEVLVLRLGAKLSVHDAGQVVQSDDVTVRRLEDRALERLEVDRELLGWSLDAPASPAELADERVVLSRYRAIPITHRRGVRTVAVGGAGSLGAVRPHRTTPGSGMARQSRAAAIAIAATSASVVSLGGITAAAYVGALPDPVQEVMHRAIGAPAPGERPQAGPGGAIGVGPTSARSGSSGRGPDATAAATAGLCRAWGEDKANGVARDLSTAFRNLVGVAGGAGQVDAYCADVLAASTGPQAPNPSSTKRPAATKTNSPATNSTKSPAATKTNAPNTNSTRSQEAANAPRATSGSSRSGAQASTATTPRSNGSKANAPRTSAPKASGAGATGR
jgi:DNA-directed RNA polymerase specialized sigma24 family protein